MGKSILTYKCLVISPGDLAPARDAVRDAVDRWNASVGELMEVRIEAVTWETHGVPDASGSPQAVLNRQIVDNADLGIALFWTRLGTPSETHPSGSVEEIERLIERDVRVMAYRGTESPDLSKVDKAQLQALNDYWASLQPRAFTGSFDSPATLARDVVVHLTQAVSVMLGRDRAGQSLQLGSGTAPKQPDVRVKLTASLVGDELRPMLSASFQNHSTNTIRMAGVHVMLPDGKSAFFKRDAVMGLLNGHRVLEPGQAYQFFFDPAEFQGNELATAEYIYAADEIERQYRAQPGALAKVLKQLRPAKE
jgi:hypothetical protein